MTALRDARPAGAAPRLVEPGRVIAIGIRDHVHDAATLSWAEAEATAGADGLHLVHAYVPLRLDGCSWDPVRRERDARGLLGRRVTAQAVQRVRAACPDLLVDGSTIQGLPEDVLHEFSSLVDLLVIGDDSADPDRVRKIAWRIQDRARCPVVCVPRAYRASSAGEPVTVVVAEGGPSEPAMRFAADVARRHNVGLEVVRVEPEDAWLPRIAARSSLLVAAGSGAPLRSAAGPSHCPTVVVPDDVCD